MPYFKVRRDLASLVEDSTASGNVLANDSSAMAVTAIRYGTDPALAVPAAGITLAGRYGTLTIFADGSYHYVASAPDAQKLAAGALASDSFTYTALGSEGQVASHTLKFALTGANDAPVLADAGAPLAPLSEDDLANPGQTVASFLRASDVDSGALGGIAVTGADPGNGHWFSSIDGGASWQPLGAPSPGAALLLRSSDLVRFVPNGDDGTEAALVYRAWDRTAGSAGQRVDAGVGGGESAFSADVATATLTVAAVEDSPIAATDHGATTGAPLLLDVLANDRDPEGTPLTLVSATGAAHGTVSLEAGQVRYTPDAGFAGSDSFSYVIADGAGRTATGLAQIEVGDPPPPPPDAPRLVSLSFRQDSAGYTAALETMVRQNRASTGFDEAFVLRPNLEAGKELQGLLRFDGLFGAGERQVPGGAQILAAALTLEVTGASANGGSIARMLTGWSASSTWNALGNGVQLDGVEASLAGVVTVGAVALGTRAFDVTDHLAAWNAAADEVARNAANHGWLFKGGGADAWDFLVRGDQRPVLTVSYAAAGSGPVDAPSVSILAASASEAAGRLTFTVRLDRAASETVEVSLATVGETARAGSDFLDAAATLRFAPGQTEQSWTVLLVDDALAERAESVSVQIVRATNAYLGSALAAGTIRDDDQPAPPVPPLAPRVVAVHNLADPGRYDDGSGLYGIADPSALAYIPSLGTLFVADSEHDEAPFFSATNLFGLTLDGEPGARISLSGFTREPTGLAYHPGNGLLYVADDDRQRISWVSPLAPGTALGGFDVARFGMFDTEDLKVDPLTGHLHVLDGTLMQMIELTATGAFVASVKLPQAMGDAEALAYDPAHDLYFVASGQSATIWVIAADGAVVTTITALSAIGPRPKIKGLELAPSSNPDDGDALSLYVADYGLDQQNDGRLIEIALGEYWVG